MRVLFAGSLPGSAKTPRGITLPPQCGLAWRSPRGGQAARCDAARSAKAHSLPRGPLQYSGVSVDIACVSHGRASRSSTIAKRPLAISSRANRPRRIEPRRREAGWRLYYIMIRLPGEPQTEFFLMLPMTPSQRENMIAWLAARCDLPEYGKLIVYEFPKDKLVYGPFQIEALINQNTGDLAANLAVGNQDGLPGHSWDLLVVPIGNSILYVSPLYLRAQSGQLPELKRVIAAYGDRVVMEETLPAALAALFKGSAPVADFPASTGSSPSGPADERAPAGPRGLGDRKHLIG